jgi:hypothetical protein
MRADPFPEAAQFADAVLGGLPAMIALLIAPMEMPAIQPGSISLSAKAS